MNDDDSEISECEELYSTASMIEGISNPTNEEIQDAAMTFFDAAQCFDKQGDRKKAATSFTLAGEFFLSIEENNKAAECYGKAIIRNLMANDVESAKVILDKGESYGDLFDTFNFRMARDSFNRQLSENIDDDIDLLQDKETLFDSESLDYDLELPDEDIGSSFDMELEKIDLTDAKTQSAFNLTADFESKSFISSFKGLSIPEQEMNKQDSKYSENIAYNLIKSARQVVDKKIISSGIAKAASGFIKDLESGSKFIRKDEINSNPNFYSKELKLNIDEINNLSNSLEDTNSLNEKLGSVDLDIESKLSLISNSSKYKAINKPLTLESEFISISEVTADDDDLEEIEIQDAIPFAWQIKNVNAAGFELLSQNVDQETGSLIFTWKKNRLERGETARILYTLRRRLQRSVVMISNKRVYVLNSFHSLDEGDEFSTVKIEFENPYDETLTHVLIEDIIPDELKVVKTDSSIDKRHLQIYSTKQGLIYRWVLNELKSKELVTLEYKLLEKPFTRWFEQVYDFNDNPILKIEKIAEPLIEYAENSYVIFYELSPDSSFPSNQLMIKDEIPNDAELLSSYPLWLRPSIEINENNQKFLVWPKIELEGKTKRFVVKIKIKDHFNPDDPIVIFPDLNSTFIMKKDDKAEGVIDLRKKMGLALVKQE